MSIEVKDNPDEHRYEAWLDGQLAGFAEYTPAQQALVFTHTEVDPAFEGKGVGSTLAKGALDDVRAKGDVQVKPQCAFISAYIDKHPEYQELVRPHR